MSISISMKVERMAQNWIRKRIGDRTSYSQDHMECAYMAGFHAALEYAGDSLNESVDRFIKGEKQQ